MWQLGFRVFVVVVGGGVVKDWVKAHFRSHASHRSRNKALVLGIKVRCRVNEDISTKPNFFSSDESQVPCRFYS